VVSIEEFHDKGWRWAAEEARVIVGEDPAADRQYRPGAFCVCTEVVNLPVGIDDALLNVLRCREVGGAVPGKMPARAILAMRERGPVRGA
jgi:hypothetical protein